MQEYFVSKFNDHCAKERKKTRGREKRENFYLVEAMSINGKYS